MNRVASKMKLRLAVATVRTVIQILPLRSSSPQLPMPMRNIGGSWLGVLLRNKPRKTLGWYGMLTHHTTRQSIAWGLLGAIQILFLCMIHAAHAVAAEPPQARRFASPTTKAGSREEHKGHGHARVRDLKFTHLTTNDGLSQGYVTAILQDRRGFMWFATRDGLNRYDGNTFVVYKHNPNDPGSLSSNFIQDLMEDDHGYLWIATNTRGEQIRPCNRTLYPLPS